MGGRCDALVSGVGLWGPALCAALLALLVALLALGFARWPTWPAPGRASHGDPGCRDGAESLHTLWCLARRPGVCGGIDAGQTHVIHQMAGSSRDLAAGSGRAGAATGNRSRRKAWDNGKGRARP